MKEEMQPIVRFCLSYGGNESDSQKIDLYDVSQALIGFQRSIALTTHLVINGEIITQSPALKGARILAAPAKGGSWEIAAIVLVAIYKIGTAPIDTPLGHIVYSVYDYLIFKSFGVHPDYDESIWRTVNKHKLDLLVEKCAPAITEMHRPIIKNKTATNAKIIAELKSKRIQVGPELTVETFAHVNEEFTNHKPVEIEGRISSYNRSTYRGHIDVDDEGRRIPFELKESCRIPSMIELVTRSLSVNAVKDFRNKWSKVYCRVSRSTRRSGHLKSYKIIKVSHGPSVKRYVKA